jgi:GntR family transcriptional regulator
VAGVIDPGADRAVYKQIADLLRTAIVTGELEPGAQLPSESELVEEHGVARGTARQAIMQLRNEGLIESAHGRGSFVRERGSAVLLRTDRLSRGWEIGRDPDDPPSERDGWEIGPLLDEPMLKAETTQLDKTRARVEVAERLGLPTGADVLMRSWSEMGRDSVQALVASFIPWDVAKAARLKQVKTGPAVYAALANSGHQLVRFGEEIEARMPTAAEGRALSISPGVPVMSVLRVSYTSENRPIEVCTSVMSGDRYRLLYEVPAAG